MTDVQLQLTAILIKIQERRKNPSVHNDGLRVRKKACDWLGPNALLIVLVWGGFVIVGLL